MVHEEKYLMMVFKSLLLCNFHLCSISGLIQHWAKSCRIIYPLPLAALACSGWGATWLPNGSYSYMFMCCAVVAMVTALLLPLTLLLFRWRGGSVVDWPFFKLLVIYLLVSFLLVSFPVPQTSLSVGCINSSLARAPQAPPFPWR